MQSITVNTRLRSADRPATCGAARGTGINVSSSTTDSTAAAGSATRSPAMVTTSRSSLTYPSSKTSSSYAPRTGRLQRHQQPCAVVAVNALILLVRRLRVGAEPDRLPARIVRNVLADRGDEDVGFLLFRIVDHAVSGGFDERPQHVLHPRIPAGNAANELLARAGSGADM